MKLHEDKFAFLNIINLIHEASSIRADILEKDYYVTLLLRELAGKQVTLPAYFKGGTALYKAQKSIRRFSEDIDLTVCIDNCSNSQAKKRLEMATKKYQALPRTSRKDLEDDRKGSITTVYDYTPLVGVDSDDPLQRFGYVKVEGTSFTVSEPFTPLEIEPILYTYARQSCRQRNPPAQKLPVFHPDTHIHPHYPWSHRFLPGGVAGVFGQFRISNGWCRYLLSGSWQTCPAGFPAEWLWLAAPDGSRAVYPGNRYAAARLFSVQ